MSKFTLNENIKVVVEAQGFEDNEEINVKLSFLDKDKKALATLDGEKGKIESGKGIYKFKIEDKKDELGIDINQIAYVKAWIDVDGDNVIDKTEEAIAEIRSQLITKDMLDAICNSFSPTTEFMVKINEYAKDFEINTSLRIAHFLAQLAHESTCFVKLKEKLYYSKDRFLELYKNTRTPNGVDFNNYDTYKHLIENDEEFANWRYGAKNKKGNIVNYRGRGYIHITWKENYQSYTNYYQTKYNDSSKNFVEMPELLEQFPYALEASFHFWSKNDINNLADQGKEEKNISVVTKKVNGGLNGLDDRIIKFNKIFNFLKEK